MLIWKKVTNVQAIQLKAWWSGWVGSDCWRWVITTQYIHIRHYACMRAFTCGAIKHDESPKFHANGKNNNAMCEFIFCRIDPRWRIPFAKIRCEIKIRISSNFGQDCRPDDWMKAIQRTDILITDEFLHNFKRHQYTLLASYCSNQIGGLSFQCSHTLPLNPANPINRP
jgi:hypothetical protein